MKFISINIFKLSENNSKIKNTVTNLSFDFICYRINISLRCDNSMMHIKRLKIKCLINGQFQNTDTNLISTLTCYRMQPLDMITL